MVSIDQIANGLMIYIRKYLIGQIPKDNPKYVMGNVALEFIGLAVNKNKQAFTEQITAYLSNNMLGGLLEVVTPDGQVDIEAIRMVAPKYIQPEGVKVKIPFIGVFSILPEDVDVVYNCIMSVPSDNNALPGGVNV